MVKLVELVKLVEFVKLVELVGLDRIVILIIFYTTPNIFDITIQRFWEIFYKMR